MRRSPQRRSSQQVIPGLALTRLNALIQTGENDAVAQQAGTVRPAAATGVTITKRPYSAAGQEKAFVQAGIAPDEPPKPFTRWIGSILNALLATGLMVPQADIRAGTTAEGPALPGLGRRCECRGQFIGNDNASVQP